MDNLNFAHMTGSGSCCFAAFNNKDIAIKAQKKFIEKFPDLWSCIAENNTIGWGDHVDLYINELHEILRDIFLFIADLSK